MVLNEEGGGGLGVTPSSVAGVGPHPPVQKIFSAQRTQNFGGLKKAQCLSYLKKIKRPKFVCPNTKYRRETIAGA